MSSRRLQTTRQARGSLGALFIVALILICMLVGALAADMAHILSVKDELQNATDAGALAGAMDLWKDIDDAEKNAYKVTAFNTADGTAVSNDVSGTEVTVKVKPPTVATRGEVEVVASKNIFHMFAPLFTRPGDTITTKSVAGTTGALQELFANQSFLIFVSLNAKGGDGQLPALNERSVGDMFTIYINSQQYKNGGFTSLTNKDTNAKYLTDGIRQLLDMDPKEPGFIPSVAVGDDIYLANGNMGQKKLASPEYTQRLTDPNRPPIILPVIEGDPAYVQTQKVVGFIGFRVTSVEINQGGGMVESITGRIVNPQVNGTSGEGGNLPPRLTGNAIGPVQLVM